MNYLEAVGALLGFIYLYLEYRASIWLWPAGIVLPAIYIFIYFDAGIYANLAINIYYLLAAMYGWYYWLYGGKRQINSNNEVLAISFMPERFYFPVILVFIVTFLTIVWLLMYFTDSTVPWIDGFTTALSIIGMWMLARKYIEQWWLWVLVNTVSCVLYINKELYSTFVLFAVSAVVSLSGYFKWRRMMLRERIVNC